MLAPSFLGNVQSVNPGWAGILRLCGEQNLHPENELLTAFSGEISVPGREYCLSKTTQVSFIHMQNIVTARVVVSTVRTAVPLQLVLSPLATF